MPFKSYNDALDYAVAKREDLDVMIDPKTNEYHVIRFFALDHWKQHYNTVAEVRVKIQVKPIWPV